MSAAGLRTSAPLIAFLPLVLAACATQSGKPGPVPASAQAASTAAPMSSAATPPAARAGQPIPVAAPTEQEIAAGIQVVHISATGGGGLVDARFKVLDAAKATALLGNPANAPQIIAGDKPALVPPHHAVRGGRLAKDQMLFIMYPNIRKAVEPGVDVYVAFGATRLGPFKAQ